MSAPAIQPKIGLLALTLELYETLAPALRPDRERWLRQTVIPALSRNAEVLFSGAVFRPEDVEATLAEYARAGVDAVVVVLLSYSPSQIALPGLQRTRLPILIWNTQELLAVDVNFGLPDALLRKVYRDNALAAFKLARAAARG